MNESSVCHVSDSKNSRYKNLFFQGFRRSCNQWDMNFKKKCYSVRKINLPFIKPSQVQETIAWHCSHACVKNSWPWQMPRLNAAKAEDSISKPSTTQRPSLTACSSRRPRPSSRDILPALKLAAAAPMLSLSYLCFNTETFLCFDIAQLKHAQCEAWGKPPQVQRTQPKRREWVRHLRLATPLLPDCHLLPWPNWPIPFSVLFLQKNYRVQYELTI